MSASPRKNEHARRAAYGTWIKDSSAHGIAGTKASDELFFRVSEELWGNPAFETAFIIRNQLEEAMKKSP